MGGITANVNWLAVAVGTVLSFALGGLWYSPKLFGTKWAEGAGVSMKGEAEQPTAALMAQFVATFMLAWVVGVTAANDALMTIILVTATIAALMAGGGMFSQKSGYSIVTETGFAVAMVVIMIICQGAL